MKNKVLKTAMAIMLIITITVADLFFVGMNIVTYALENVDSSTSNENVKFAAYFKTAEGESTNAECEVDKTDMKLYLMIAVENQGYFDGEISLENSNFKIKEEELNKEIGQIDGNRILLNRVRAGNIVEIEVGIEPVIEEIVEDDILNKETQIKLIGTYTNNEEQCQCKNSNFVHILAIMCIYRSKLVSV